MSPPHTRLAQLRLAASHLGSVVALGLLPVVVGVIVLATAPLWFDFEIFWTASRDVLAGRTPYPPLEAEVLATAANFVYPPAAAYLMAPFAALPLLLAGSIFTLLSLAALPLALWLLGVRDWRCYGAAMLAPPILNGIAVGALSALLALAVAAVWRWRDRPLVAGPVVALVVVLKLYLWPLGLWLLVTRRVRSALLAAGITVVVTLAAWAAIGFEGFTTYPRLLELLSDELLTDGYSPVALALTLGQSEGVANAFALVAGGTAVGVCVLTGLRRRSPESDLASFSAALAAALLLSPIVWMHYLAVLFVPVAASRRRLSAVWLAPLALWLTPAQSDGVPWRIALGLAIVLVTLGVAARRRRQPSSAPDTSGIGAVAPSRAY